MTKSLTVVLAIALMIGVIVGADLLFFRHRFQARLIANVCIVAVFAAFYFFLLARKS